MAQSNLDTEEHAEDFDNADTSEQSEGPVGAVPDDGKANTVTLVFSAGWGGRGHVKKVIQVAAVEVPSKDEFAAPVMSIVQGLGLSLANPVPPALLVVG